MYKEVKGKMKSRETKHYKRDKAKFKYLDECTTKYERELVI